MGTRRWSVLVALASAGLVLAGIGCGGDEEDAGCGGEAPDGYQDVSIEVREPKGASPTDVEAAAEIICSRTEVLGVDDAAVRTEGTERIVVSVPRDGAAEAGQELARAARLRMYNWDANLIPGGGTADEPIPSYMEAERVASTQDDGIVLRAEPPLRGFVAFRNRPSLRNEDIREIALEPDPQTGGPSITLEFTDRGQQKFRELTRSVAQDSEPGSPARFAVAVDAEIVAVPEVDPAANPKGIDSPAVTLVGGIPFEEAELLTDLLQIGHLPIALDLEPAENAEG
jgi:preprotein translocase subunit SecD